MNSTEDHTYSYNINSCKQKINIIGDIFGLSGYCIHTRKLANAFNEIGYDVRIDSNKPQQWERLVNDFELNALTKPFDHEATTIMISQPPSWSFGLAQKPKTFYGYCIWEGDKIPEYWLKYLSDTRVDKILIASKHNKDAILNTEVDMYDKKKINKLFLTSKIQVVPHGVDTAIFYPTDKEPRDKLIFLANKGWNRGLTDRGGIQWLVKAFVNEFTNKDNIQLRLKLNPAYGGINTFRQRMEAIGLKKTKTTPEIVMCGEALEENTMRKLYNECDVFITTSMAEAFNIPCLEALACGLPVITTDFGGQTDFVNNNNGWIIRGGKLGYYSDELIYKHTKWLKPNIKSIQKIMRKIYNDRELIKNRIENTTLTASEYTWKDTAKKISGRERIFGRYG